jgi:hypothetical protein
MKSPRRQSLPAGFFMVAADYGHQSLQFGHLLPRLGHNAQAKQTPIWPMRQRFGMFSWPLPSRCRI